MYKSDGVENLRAQPSVYAGSENASPAGKGKDAGGTANLGATTETKTGATKPMPTSYRHDVPPGLQSFDDNGQKEGGTKYLGG